MASSNKTDPLEPVEIFFMHVARIIPLAGVGLMYQLLFYNVPLEFLDEECHIGRENNVDTSDYMNSSIWLASASIISSLFFMKLSQQNTIDGNVGNRVFDFILGLASAFGMLISLILITYTAMTGTCTYDVDNDGRNGESYILKAFASTLFAALLCCSVTVAYYLYTDDEKYSGFMDSRYGKFGFAAICFTGNIVASIFVFVLVLENEVVSCQALRSDSDIVTTMQILGTMMLPVLAGDTMMYLFADAEPIFGGMKSLYSRIMPLHDLFKVLFAIFVSVVMNTTTETWENDYLNKDISSACLAANVDPGSFSNIELFNTKTGHRNMTMQILSGVLLGCAIVEFVGHLMFAYNDPRNAKMVAGDMSTAPFYNQLMNAA